MDLEFTYRYRALQARDARFDGWFVTAVTSTGVYCRPSCPARTPKPANVRFFASAAAAEAAGFRACKRCRPNARPGSPEWDARAEAVSRAVALIAEGVVDREGVAGLARRLAFTERHLHRLLVSAVGAGPLALARARRAHTARLLLEATALPMSEVAFAAGFRSLRQFNASIREVFGRAPGELRRGAAPGPSGLAAGTVAPGTPAFDPGPATGAVTVDLRLPYRAPCDVGALLAFLAARAVPGVEDADPGMYRRSLRLPHGAGIITLRARSGADGVDATIVLDDVSDLGAAVASCRRLLALDADPEPILHTLGADAIVGPLVRAAPGRRVPGHVDPAELAIRAVVGQQVSVAGAATLTARLVAAHGEALTRPAGSVTHLFPSPAALAEADPGRLPMPQARAAALVTLAGTLSSDHVVLDGSMPRDEVERRLSALPGIGPWTTSYISMRALNDPDAFMPTDLGVRRALELLGHDGRPPAARRLADAWRPYRAYATQHLWAHLAASANRTLASAAVSDTTTGAPARAA